MTGGDLVGFKHRPGQEIILRLTPANGDVIRRHYTIGGLMPRPMCSISISCCTVTAPRTLWRAKREAGRSARFHRPRGRVAFDPDAEWHVFVGDEPVFPAFSRCWRLYLQNRAPLHLSKSDDAKDKQRLRSEPTFRSNGCTADGAPAGPSRILAIALRRFDFPAGLGRAYIIGETSNARLMRRELIARGFPKGQISAEGYWRPGRVGGHDHVDDEHA